MLTKKGDLDAYKKIIKHFYSHEERWVTDTYMRIKRVI
jgi:hypothetical protein